MRGEGDRKKATKQAFTPATRHPVNAPFRKEDGGEAKKRPTWPCPWNPYSPRPNARAALPFLLMHLWTRPLGTWKQGQPMACSHYVLLGSATKWGYGEYLPTRAVLYYNPQRADEETEAQSSGVFAQGHKLTVEYCTAGLTSRQGCSK